MPNVYYCSPLKKCRGILRAVLSAEEAGRLLNALSVEYVGTQFPVVTNQTGDFAILRIAEEEEELEGKWPVGCYRLNADVANVELAVQACTTKLSQVRPTSQILKSLVYFPL